MLPDRRPAVNKWTREELEDRFFRAHEENVVLKRHARKQESRIKRISTKLLRLMNDRKKQANNKGASGKRDVEMEQIIEEQQDNIRQLERQNKLFQERLIVVKQQLDTQLKRPVPAGYRHVSSRIDTGLPRYAVKPSSSSAVHNAAEQQNYPTYATYTVNKPETLVNGSNESFFKDQLQAYEQEISVLQEQLQDKEARYAEDIMAIKSQLSHDQRKLLQENVSMIRLQRELKQLSSQLLVVEAECDKAKEDLRISHKDHEELLAKADQISQQLREEQQKSSSLHSEVMALTMSKMMVEECQEKIADLEKENAILRDSNNKLIENALDYEKFSKMHVEKKRHAEPTQQELSTMRSSMAVTDLSKEELIKERAMRLELDKELSQMRKSFGQLQEQHEELKLRQMKNEAANLNRFDDAETSWRRNMNDTVLSPSAADEDVARLEKKLTEVQADHAETTSELEKTRDMLIVQHRINKDSQEEVESLTRRLGKMQQDHEERVSEQDRLLKLRELRIQRLEQQLKDVLAYGPHQIVPDQTNIDNAINKERQASVPQKSSSSMQAPNVSKAEMETTEKSVLDETDADRSPQPKLPIPKPRTSTPKTTLKQDKSKVSFDVPMLPEDLPETSKTIESAAPSSKSSTAEKAVASVPKMASYTDSSSDDGDDDDIAVSLPKQDNKGPRLQMSAMEFGSDDDDEDDDDESGSESDSDLVVSPETAPSAAQDTMSNRVVIVVSYLSFTSNAAVLTDDSINMLYVEYRFLDFPTEELETPFALAKPAAANQRVVYNFSKSFSFDVNRNLHSRQSLMNVIRGTSDEAKRIKFTVVSEPPEDDEEAECEDVGYASVDLGQIIVRKKDIVNEEILVFDVHNQKSVIGHLNVTVEALSTLKTLLKSQKD